MAHVDARRSTSRRDSSLIITKGSHQPHFLSHKDEWYPRAKASSSSKRLNTESANGWGSIRKELVTSLFESMVENIVQSWEVIIPAEDSTGFGKMGSDSTVASKRKKTGGHSSNKILKSKKKSKSDMEDSQQCDPIMQCWWSGADEKAIIRFKNGNIYEGDISNKCMHGEGIFRWADGTVYSGQFYDNAMKGKGLLQWKDDTWYRGEFAKNVRHGQGLYVDSRSQRYYVGGWLGGTKDGKGFISYGADNYYDGDWVKNVRHGQGTGEYSAQSGYIGKWDLNVRDSNGTMIWPNCDFYSGGWKNGVMHGNGYYVWEAPYNNSMSLSSQNSYRGSWDHGLRNGYGVLKLGLEFGSHYKGYFIKNRKDGYGKFITNNGLVFEDDNLFCNDTIGPINVIEATRSRSCTKDPHDFKICDDTVGLMYHVKVALCKIDIDDDIRTSMVNDFIYNNKPSKSSSPSSLKSKEELPPMKPEDFEDLCKFEEEALRKALVNYETHLKNIYYNYAKICNTEGIVFTPKLIRLYLWQLYHDIDIHRKGLTLVEIDDLFHANQDWLSQKPHDPFETIFFWQFLHHLILVANILYGKRHLPGRKPDTMVASAFRTFIATDVLPACCVHTGRLVEEYGKFVPLKGLYELYCRVGEPHTVRQYLNAVRRPKHCTDQSQPELVEAPGDCLPVGRNMYVFEDMMTFIIPDKKPPPRTINQPQNKDFPLFNFRNLSTKTIIKHFTHILPQVCDGDVIKNLDVPITFYEFFEVFVACAEDSIRVKEKEIRFREKFCVIPEPVPISRSCSRLIGTGSRHASTTRASTARVSSVHASIGRMSSGRASIARSSLARVTSGDTK